MKTTLNIDDRLLAKAKAQAVREKKTLTKLIEEGLNLRLRPRQETTQLGKARIEIPVFRGGGGMAPGIDPCSNKSMFDACDEDDG